MTTFSEWMCVEAVNVPPHMPEKYFKEKLAEFQKLEQQGKELAPLMKTLESIIEIFMNSSSRPRTFDSLYYWLSRATRIDNHDFGKLSDYIGRLFDKAGKLEISNFVNVFNEALEKQRLINEEFRRAFIGDGSDYEEVVYQVKNSKDYWPEQDEFPYSYEQTLQILSKIKVLFFEQMRFLRLIREVGRKASAILDRLEIKDKQQYGGWNDRVVLPAHQQVEILYHATPFVREILKSGFKTKEELGFETLGGNTEKAISFTADVEIAREIVRSIKEAILISQGKVGVKDVMQWVKQDAGNKPEVKKWLSGTEWLQDYKSYQRSVLRGKPNNNDVSLTWKLFKTYLALTSARYNPVFFAVYPENFAHLDINNVGTLACKVDMSKVVRYLNAMEEYRVPVDAILTTRLLNR